MIMKKLTSKERISICLDSKIANYLKDNFENRSKYVEYLIYQDLKKSDLLKDDKLNYYKYNKPYFPQDIIWDDSPKW